MVSRIDNDAAQVVRCAALGVIALGSVRMQGRRVAIGCGRMGGGKIRDVQAIKAAVWRKERILEEG